MSALKTQDAPPHMVRIDFSPEALPLKFNRRPGLQAWRSPPASGLLVTFSLLQF